MSQDNGNSTSLRLKTGLAEMLKGGVIMDVTNAEQAVIAEKAGAVSVMALERVPAQIRAEGGVARMASPKKIREIMAAVSIPVMAKCRIGHFAEAQILQELGVDYIDESEVLTPADEAHHVDKHAFKVPFVCGARNLGEALRRIAEGAAMIRTKGEAGTGDVVHAVKHMRQIVQEMRILTVLGEEELYAKAKEHQAPYELVRMVAKAGKLPVPNFSAGGIATPADAALVMQLGFCLAHEAVHSKLHPNHNVNEALGVLLFSLFPGSYGFFKVAHLIHHQRNRSDAELEDYVLPGETPWLKR